MGNNICYGDQCPRLELMATKLQNMLAMANKTQSREGKFTTLLHNHSVDLKSIIKSAQYAKKIFGTVTVEVVPYSQQNISYAQQQMPSNVKLVLRWEAQEESESTFHEKKQNDDTYEGCIVFTEAFYCGEVKTGMAHGRGTLYLQGHTQYEVQGTWQYDSLKRADFFHIKYRENECKRQRKFVLELINGEKEAILKVQGKFEYRGSIKLRGAKNIYEIMTGKGVIRYQNGDSYDGQLINGLYNTVRQEAKCTYASGQYSRFKGYFKSGLRQGRGTLTMLVKNQPCELSLDFSNGNPVGLARLNFFSEKTQFPIDIQDNKAYISNHRMSDQHI